MDLSDSDFAEVLNHLYEMSRKTRLNDSQLAESLMRAAVILLAAESGRSAASEARAEDMLRRTMDWCRRMTPNCP